MTENHMITEEDPEGIKGGMEHLPSTIARPLGVMQDERSGSEVYDDELAVRGDALYGVAGPPSHAALALRCPFCDEEVCGENEDELTQHLREHVRDGHGIEPARKT